MKKYEVKKRKKIIINNRTKHRGKKYNEWNENWNRELQYHGQVEERICELKERSFELSQSEKKKEKRNEKDWRKPMGFPGHY